MKSFRTLSVIREMQTKATMILLCITRMAKIKKTDNTNCWRKYAINGVHAQPVEVETFTNHLWKEFDMICSCWRSWYSLTQELQPCACALERVYTNVHSNSSRQSPRMKTSQTLVNSRMDEFWSVNKVSHSNGRYYWLQWCRENASKLVNQKIEKNMHFMYIKVKNR